MANEVIYSSFGIFQLTTADKLFFLWAADDGDIIRFGCIPTIKHESTQQMPTNYLVLEFILSTDKLWYSNQIYDIYTTTLH